MAEFIVAAQKIELFEHPDSDHMVLGKLGEYQVVVAKSNGYKDGDIVVFAPERSILPEYLRGHYVNSETGISYLGGHNNDRVKSVRLRGQLSEGVTIPIDTVLDKLGTTFELGVDLSTALGITKYEPPIPDELAGEVKPLTSLPSYKKHDVEQYGIYKNEFVPGEQVRYTEKVHGSQINIYCSQSSELLVTSKGMASRELTILESDSNLYWRAVKSSGASAKLREAGEHSNGISSIQLFAELLPCQSGYTYGQTTPTLRFYRYVVGGIEIDKNLAPQWIQDLWVPIIYEGPYDPATIETYAKGKEQVSGKELHIREGIVAQPVPPRQRRGGSNLMGKVINPKYKSSDEDFS